MPCAIDELPKKETIVRSSKKSYCDEAQEDFEVAETLQTSSANSNTDHTIDHIFYRICNFCFLIGVNFYPQRSSKLRWLSLVIVAVVCSINLYLVFSAVYLTLSKPFETERVATSISICSWMLQATMSTIFLSFWQHTSQTCKIRKLLHEANEGKGIQQHLKDLSSILKLFYLVVALWIVYYAIMIAATLLMADFGDTDMDIIEIFGDRRLFIIVQLTGLYSIICWAVAFFIYSLLIHSTHYEFLHFNEQVRSIKCDADNQTDEELCDYILKLMKIHNRLTECVKRLDKMFHRYAFIMIATIIPTTIFALFIIFRAPRTSGGYIPNQLLFSCPIISLCVFSFFALVNAPSQLHTTIYNTKSALCANTHVWFPYRPNVYHSALAFVAHLDQTNLGVSIWGFAVVSKPLVLTTLSVMATCLALFLQLGDCTSHRSTNDEEELINRLMNSTGS